MLEATFKQGAGSSLLQVQGLHVGGEEDLHEPGQGFIRLLPEQEMIMSGHEAVGYDGRTMLLAGAPNELEEATVITRVEDIFCLPAPRL